GVGRRPLRARSAPLRREPPDRDEMLLVVGRVEPAYLDAAPALRRMGEAAAAEGDADVRQLLLVLKEDEVARSGRARRDVSCRAGLLLRRARHGEARVGEGVVVEPAAVDSLFRARAAVAIRRADERDRKLCD